MLLETGRESAFDDSEDFVLAHHQQVFAVDFDGVAARIRAEDHFVAHFDGQGTNFAVVQDATGADGDDFAAVWFSAAEPGRTIPPAVFDSSSLRRMTTRSCRGRSFIVDLSQIVVFIGRCRYRRVDTVRRCRSGLARDEPRIYVWCRHQKPCGDPYMWSAKSITRLGSENFSST